MIMTNNLNYGTIKLWALLFILPMNYAPKAMTQNEAITKQSITSQDIDAKTVPTSNPTFKIDGIMNEIEWQQALVIPLLFETSPAENVPAQVKTEAYFIDTGKTLVIGFKAEDPEPRKIRAFLRDRDSAYSDDFVGVLFDTYNMKIPYNELQMPDSVSEKTWGLFAFRIHPRDDRRLYKNVIIDRNNDCFLCQTEKIKGFNNADRGMDLEVAPTITGLAAKNREPEGTEFGSTDSNFEAGVDVNWGINSNLTLNVTINPDFSQVEADSAQLNVNQNFALFFPQRRSFFLENSDYFDSNMNLVHTRNIADSDYGVRLVGKYDQNACGIYFTNDTITNLLIPGVLGSDFTDFRT